MSRATRFASRESGPAARMASFMAHLRDNGLRLGVGEAMLALDALCNVEAQSPDEARAALKAVCTSCTEDVERFDELFDSFWLNGGRVRTRYTQKANAVASPQVHSSRRLSDNLSAGGSGDPSQADDGEGEVEQGGEGKLVASSARNLFKTDLRELVRPEDIAEAEVVARRLGEALRDKRSRRRRAASRGQGLHFRRTIRQSLGTGGEPIHLVRSFRPERPLKVCALCDVSGSMSVHSRVFLSFIAGLLRSDPHGDAYLFHTRLVRVTDALREQDALRALARLSLLADGFGGGSHIGQSVAHFARTYARRFVDGRTVVLILSDGYDTADGDVLSAALAQLKRRGCKIIWLNPLKSWGGYEPVARAMAAALPHLDMFRPASRLSDIAALEQHLVRL